MAYAESNKREFETTKHVSLKEWFPLKLIDMRRFGKCDFDLPEALFDLDCPGHSFRRLRAVALSVPCIIGPYASVNCAVTLTQSFVRRDKGGYPGIHSTMRPTLRTTRPRSSRSLRAVTRATLACSTRTRKMSAMRRLKGRERSAHGRWSFSGNHDHSTTTRSPMSF